MGCDSTYQNKAKRAIYTFSQHSICEWLRCADDWKWKPCELSSAVEAVSQSDASFLHMMLGGGSLFEMMLECHKSLLHKLSAQYFKRHFVVLRAMLSRK